MTAMIHRIGENPFQTAQPVDATLRKSSAGMVSGTKVATRNGWRPVERLAPGDLVLTFDNGLQPLVHVGRYSLMANPLVHSVEDWPLFVPEGALGNLAPLILTPGQVILIESDLADRMFADPFVAVPALCLDGIAGIERVRPDDRIAVTSLHFEEDQAVFGAGGAMFVCEGNGNLLSAGVAEAYPVIDGDLAREILSEGLMPAGAGD